MEFSRRFFELNWLFALKVAELAQRPLADVLLEYTQLYMRLYIGRDFNQQNAIWQAYLQGIAQASDPVEWTFQFYQERHRQCYRQPNILTFGCFYYNLLPDHNIRIHFHNADEGLDERPLSLTRLPVRRTELTEMFAHLKAQRNDSVCVVGCSWLYNLEGYCRLFPPAYLATAKIRDNEFPFLTLWGQFINRHGQVREAVASQFLNRLQQQQSLETIQGCFPLQPLSLICSVEHFYEFYQV